MNTTKDDQLILKRLAELSLSSFHKGLPVYSDFLNPNEISLFYSMKKDLPNINYQLWGGYQLAERKVVCFYDEDSFQNPSYDISCIEIKPLNDKFSDALTHRDFLGAILNLGIDRSKIGDIITKENTGYVFCKKNITEFIIDQLYKIKHTHIMCQESDLKETDITPNFKEIVGTISSVRLDAVLSIAFNTSRSSLTTLIKSGKVYVNSKLVESNSYLLKEDDIVSVRGLGKFVYKGITNQSRKGRYYTTILKYM